MNCCPLTVRKAWLHPEREDATQQWCSWLHEKKKEDEETGRDEEHRKLVTRMISSPESGAGFLHILTKPTTWRGCLQVLEDWEEGAKSMRRCERKEERVGEVLAV